MSRNTLFLLAAGSFLLFTIAGWGIMQYFGPISLSEAFQGSSSFFAQVIYGLVLGIILGVAACLLIDLPFLSDTKIFFEDIISPWKLNWLEIVFVSACAGIGEEILFRGGVQPLLGIGWTSLLFVLIHGYLNPFNVPLTVYGIFMVGAIALLGIATVNFGLTVAIVAHTTIDIVLLHKLSNTRPNTLAD